MSCLHAVIPLPMPISTYTAFTWKLFSSDCLPEPVLHTLSTNRSVAGGITGTQPILLYWGHCQHLEPILDCPVHKGHRNPSNPLLTSHSCFISQQGLHGQYSTHSDLPCALRALPPAHPLRLHRGHLHTAQGCLRQSWWDQQGLAPHHFVT